MFYHKWQESQWFIRSDIYIFKICLLQPILPVLGMWSWSVYCLLLFPNPDLQPLFRQSSIQAGRFLLWSDTTEYTEACGSLDAVTNFLLSKNLRVCSFFSTFIIQNCKEYFRHITLNKEIAEMWELPFWNYLRFFFSYNYLPSLITSFYLIYCNIWRMNLFRKLNGWGKGKARELYSDTNHGIPEILRNWWQTAGASAKEVNCFINLSKKKKKYRGLCSLKSPYKAHQVSDNGVYLMFSGSRTTIVFSERDCRIQLYFQTNYYKWYIYFKLLCNCTRT